MSLTTRLGLLVAAAALLAPTPASADPALTPVGGSFDAPIYAASPPRDPSRLFVAERSGVVKVVKNDAALAGPFLDISAEVATDGERGFLSIAFPPDYESSGLIYVYMVARAPVGELQVREFQRSADPDRAVPGPGRIVWRQAHDEASNHNGGQVEFGPDGLLWLAPGDGGGSNDQFGHAQDLGSQLGKLLRIDPRPSGSAGHSIPPGNPYGTTVWAAGLRNPFRFSFDRGSGDLFIGDVGQRAREEIDRVTFARGLEKAGNYGWPCREGSVAGPRTCAAAPWIEPAFDYGRTQGRSVTGGYVVRDPGLPSLNGRYVYADFFDGQTRSFPPDDPRAPEVPTGLDPRPNLASFAEDACGHLYLVSLAGSVDRVSDPEGPAATCTLKPDPRPLIDPNAVTPTPAGTAGAEGGQTAGATAPAPDRSAPVLTLGGARRQRLGSSGAIRVAARCSEECALSTSARIAGARVRRTTRLPASRTIGIRLRLSRAQSTRVRRSLRRHRSLLVRVSARATDAAGNARSVTRRIRVRR